MGYVGVPPQSGFITTAKQRVTSSTNNYVDLDHSISSLADVIVWVNFVKQDSTNLSLTTSSRITLGANLVASDICEIAYLGKAVATQTPDNGTITLDMLSASGTKSSSTFLRGDNTFATAGVDGISSSSSSTAISIDSNGHVTKPLNTYVDAFMNADQTVNADDNNHNLQLNAELKDLNADFNVSNYTFTAPVDGAYMCSAFIGIIENTSSNATDWFFGFNASNGLDRGFGGNPSVYETSSGSNYTKTISFSKILYMDANDTMTLIADVYSGGSFTFKVDGSTGYHGATSLQVYLLG